MAIIKKNIFFKLYSIIEYQICALLTAIKLITPKQKNIILELIGPSGHMLLSTSLFTCIAENKNEVVGCVVRWRYYKV